MTDGSRTGATAFSPRVQRLRRFGLQRGWPVIGAASRLARAMLARRKPVIAVVGSYGKTTTTAAIPAPASATPSPDRPSTSCSGARAVSRSRWSWVSGARAR